jgi:hypothetical protein
MRFRTNGLAPALMLTLLPLALAGQAAPVTGAREPALSVDGSFVRLGLAYLRSADAALLQQATATRPARVIAEHARRVSLGGDPPTAEELVARLLTEQLRDGARTEAHRLGALLAAIEADEEGRRRCRVEAAAYLPEGALEGVVLHLTLGYDIGVALAGAPTLNLAHPRFRHDPRELRYYCVHEVHHAGVMRYHDLPELASVRTTAQLAALVRYLTFLEGLAVHAARAWRAADGALDRDADYVALEDQALMRRYEDDFVRLHEGLDRPPDRPLEPEDWATLERLAGPDRFFYRVGARMADRVERALGRDRLVEAVSAGPDHFFELHLRVSHRCPSASGQRPRPETAKPE